ncbi:MAG: hypothetical protein WD768_22260 [Phycisphaeraceae bacterium]
MDTTTRKTRDEDYVLDLCDEVLREKARRQHRFEWLRGDPGMNGHTSTLPVDGYYERLGIVVEYRERQHDEPVPFFDKRKTISGVNRGEQRRLYDKRRDNLVPAHRLKLIVIRPKDLDANKGGRLRRTKETDRQAISAILGPCV